MSSQPEEWHARHLTSNNQRHSHTLTEDKPYQSTHIKEHKDRNENRHISNAPREYQYAIVPPQKSTDRNRHQVYPRSDVPPIFFLCHPLFLEGPFWNALCEKCSSLLMEISQKRLLHGGSWGLIRHSATRAMVSISRWSHAILYGGRASRSFNPRLPGFISRGKRGWSLRSDGP